MKKCERCGVERENIVQNSEGFFFFSPNKSTNADYVLSFCGNTNEMRLLLLRELTLWLRD